MYKLSLATALSVAVMCCMTASGHASSPQEEAVNRSVEEACTEYPEPVDSRVCTAPARKMVWHGMQRGKKNRGFKNRRACRPRGKRFYRRIP